MTTIELAVYRLKPEALKEEFQAALAETDRWLASQPGFVTRRHGVGEDGRLDYVEWETMAAAQAAADKFVSAPETRAFTGSIDPASVTMRHFELAP